MFTDILLWMDEGSSNPHAIKSPTAYNDIHLGLIPSSLIPNFEWELPKTIET